MGFLEIKCKCGSKLTSVNDNLQAKGDKVCSSCKRRMVYQYDPRSRRVVVSPK